LYFVVGLAALAMGFMMWFITSPWVAASILWAENHYPQLVGTKSMKVSEMIICGLQVFGCFALAIWIARMMIS
jgi:hypothetical protein